jgi:hypothetical protein
MLPVEGAASNVPGAVKFIRGGLLDCPTGPVTMLGASETDVYLGSSKSSAAWVWGGNYGALLRIPDVEGYTNDWALATPFARIEDRNLAASGRITKIYVPRTWSVAEAIVPGAVYHSKVTVTFAYFPSGAEAALVNL